MLDIIILSLAFVLHLWSFPYPFKSIKFEFILGVIQILFSITVIIKIFPDILIINRFVIITGVLVGLSCLVFHILYDNGIKLKSKDISIQFLISQIFILFMQIPSEELLYRGVFFSITNSMWGPGVGIAISVSLSTMLYIATWRRPLYWLGASLVSFFCTMGLYYTGSIWTAIIIHILNDLGYITLKEKKNLFH